MVGDGRPSTSVLAAISKAVDGGPEPVIGRAFGPTRRPAMTRKSRAGHRQAGLCQLGGSYVRFGMFLPPVPGLI